MNEILRINLRRDEVAQEMAEVNKEVAKNDRVRAQAADRKVQLEEELEQRRLREGWLGNRAHHLMTSHATLGIMR